jgi:hypothetical protein
MYVKPDCPYCQAAREHLAAEGETVEERLAGWLAAFDRGRNPDGDGRVGGDREAAERRRRALLSVARCLARKTSGRLVGPSEPRQRFSFRSAGAQSRSPIRRPAWARRRK